MTYNKGGVVISVDKIKGFGKNPALWIGWDDPFHLVKVASFGNEEKAKAFCRWFEYLIGTGKKEAVKWDDD